MRVYLFLLTISRRRSRRKAHGNLRDRIDLLTRGFALPGRRLCARQAGKPIAQSCPKSTVNIPSECRTGSINPDHAMILPHDANPKLDEIFGKDNSKSGEELWSIMK